MAKPLVRLQVVQIGIGIALLALVLRAAQVQLVEGRKYAAFAKAQRTERVVLDARLGSPRARRGAGAARGRGARGPRPPRASRQPPRGGGGGGPAAAGPPRRRGPFAPPLRLVRGTVHAARRAAVAQPARRPSRASVAALLSVGRLRPRRDRQGGGRRSRWWKWWRWPRAVTGQSVGRDAGIRRRAQGSRRSRVRIARPGDRRTDRRQRRGPHAGRRAAGDRAAGARRCDREYGSGRRRRRDARSPRLGDSGL